MIDPKPDSFRIYGDSDERYHVRGGNDLIVGALARRLESASRRAPSGGGLPAPAACSA